MSLHYKFEVHLAIPAQDDGEEQAVRQFAERVRKLAQDWQEETGIEVSVGEVWQA